MLSPHDHDPLSTGPADQGYRFKVHGLDCHEEVTLLKDAVGPLVGGKQRLQFDLLQGQMSVLGNDLPPPERILAAIRASGLRAEEWQQWEQHRLQVLTAEVRPVRTLSWTELSTLLLLAAWGWHVLRSGDVWGTFHGWNGLAGADLVAVGGLYLCSLLCALGPMTPRIVQAIRRLRPDMYALMALAVTGGVLLGDWQEAATVACLFAWSLKLESWTLSRARLAIHHLLDLTPRLVRLITDHGHDHRVPVESVNVGDCYRVLPGETFALDGEVVAGQGTVDQSPITGESLPVAKQPGDPVFAGSLNGASPLEIRATQRVEHSTLARMTKIVEAAQLKKSESEAWVDRFAHWYTPLVFLLALLVWGLPVLIGGRNPVQAVRPALVLLVISCPCALVISTPVCVMAALASAARHGVLVKGGRLLEVPAAIDAVALDKTGTLTTGQIVVMEMQILGDVSAECCLQLAASLEQYSLHPLGQALVQEARSRGLSLLSAVDVQELTGKGILGTIEGQGYAVGSRPWLESQFPDHGQDGVPHAVESDRSRIFLVTSQGKRLAYFVVAQTLRDEISVSVRAMKAQGVRRVVMLTGDHAAAASRAAQGIEIDEIRADLLPEQKVAAIEELLSSYSTVAMVGDGINDAPALARATLGVALGGIGSDAALHTADVVLMSDDLRQLPWLMRHSRRMLGILTQNLVFALGVKLVFVLLALWGWSTMWGAVAADMGTTFLVVANALRLLSAKH